MIENLPESVLQSPLAIGIALILVFIVIRFLDHLKYERKETNELLSKINDSFASAIRDMHTQTLTFIAKEGETNRLFLQTQREQTSVALSRLAEEMKSMNVDISKEISVVKTKLDERIQR